MRVDPATSRVVVNVVDSAQGDNDVRAFVAKARKAGPVTVERTAEAPQTFAASIRSVPILLQMGRTDGFYTAAEAERLYELIPGARKELVWYESGHRLPPEYAPRAVGWLRSNLR